MSSSATTDCKRNLSSHCASPDCEKPACCGSEQHTGARSYLGRRQFKDLLGLLGLDVDDDMLYQKFSEMDADGNGQIEFDGARCHPSAASASRAEIISVSPHHSGLLKGLLDLGGHTLPRVR